MDEVKKAMDRIDAAQAKVKAVVQKVTEDAVEYEKYLIASMVQFDVTYGELSWAPDQYGNFRVMIGKKPLAESKGRDRLRMVSELPKLMSAIADECEKRAGGSVE